MLERGTGYHLEHRKNGFFAKRNTKGSVPTDGHWRFIVLCAELAQNRLYITDIRVSRQEAESALKEAGLTIPLRDAALGCPLFGATSPNFLSAADILSIRSNGIRQQSSFVHFPKLHSGKKKRSAL
jgi:hypothetical protein